MRIISAEVFAIRLPLHQPFVVSYGRFDDMPSILLKITTDDGVEGWGEAVPDPHVTAESFEGAFASLCQVLLPCLQEVSVCETEAAHRRMDAALAANPSIKAAVDIALHDAWAKTLNQPLSQLIGGRASSAMTQPYVISIKTPAAVATEAAEAIDRGFTEIKLKVGGQDQADVARIHALSSAAEGRARLRVDANQGWDRSTALQVIRKSTDCGIQWYEQPLAAADVEGLAALRRATDARLMIDEGVHTPGDLIRAIRCEAADMVNIKLMKAGGIRPALALATIAEAAGLSCQIGSMVESAVGTAAGLHLACTRSVIKSHELVGPEMIASDIAEFSAVAGKLRLPAGSGLGVVPHAARLEELIVSRHQWRAHA